MFKQIELRTFNNYDTDLVSAETGLLCDDVSLAVQSEADDADINTIVKRFGLTGMLPQGVRVPEYGDFTGVSDYQSALNTVLAADEAFSQMPADVRYRFRNDPAEFMKFVHNPANYDEAVKLGLSVPKPAPAEPAAPVSASETVKQA